MHAYMLPCMRFALGVRPPIHQYSTSIVPEASISPASGYISTAMIHKCQLMRPRFASPRSLVICTPSSYLTINPVASTIISNRYTRSTGFLHLRPALGNNDKGRESAIRHDSSRSAEEYTAELGTHGSRRYGGYAATRNQANIPYKDTSPRSGGKGQIHGDDPQKKRSFNKYGLATMYIGVFVTWVFYHVEPVPITGRWQFRIDSGKFDGPVEKGGERSSSQEEFLRLQGEFFGKNCCTMIPVGLSSPVAANYIFRGTIVKAYDDV